MSPLNKIARIFEDADVLAIEKPEGVTSIPGRGKEENLLELLTRQFGQKMYVVHRLDKEVSGVMLFAKHAAAHKCLNDQFSAREIHKIYVAVTRGALTPDHGVIDAPLREFGSGRMGVDAQRGKASRTEFRITERSPHFTVVLASPLTGRRHQLRVHFYSLGHPIAGDLKYGDKAQQRKFPRLLLHAHQISFRRPSGAPLTLESPLPESFLRVLETLRHGGYQ